MKRARPTLPRLGRYIKEYTAMFAEKPSPTRFFGLDIHKCYLVAVGVDPAGE